MKFSPSLLPLLCAGALLLVACDQSPDHAAPMHDDSEVPTNRIEVPLSVRQNLGITFAPVERRSVAHTVRYPGVFELMSTARRQYIAPAGGRVEVLVGDYQRVEPGTPLFRVHSPEWARVRGSMNEALLTADALRGMLEAHGHHHEVMRRKLAFWKERLAQLEQLSLAGGGQQALIADARANIIVAESEFAEAEEKHQELFKLAVPYLGAEGAGEVNPTFELALNEASALLGMGTEELRREVEGQPYWQTIDSLEVLALGGGVVEPIPVASGALVGHGMHVVTVTDPALLRFRAKAPQSDLARLMEGAVVRLVPLSPSSSESMEGTLAFGLEADSRQRTIDLVINPSGGSPAPWARPGVGAIAEVVVDGGGAGELAIPQRAVITDGLQRVFFRRDPDNPNQVLRMEADAGVSDGRWVEILSGLREGDEVVVGGVYELMLGSSSDGTRQQGGHFHADGTFHEAAH